MKWYEYNLALINIEQLVKIVERLEERIDYLDAVVERLEYGE